MNELLSMRFLRLLSEPSQEVTNEEMRNAYGEFVEQELLVIEVITPQSTGFL